MTPAVPAFLSPYMLFGTLATLSAILFGLNRALTAARWSVADRTRSVWTAATLLAVSCLAAWLTSRLGFYQGTASGFPTIQFGIVLPILAGILLFSLSGPFKHVVETVPQQWIVGVQLYRTLGVVFLILYAIGRLPAAFAVPAGAGDVLVGLLAPLVATAYARNLRYAKLLVLAWNLLGLADLGVALTTGFLTSPSKLQQFAFDAPNTLIGRYPLAMVPVFLAPLAILLHLASLQKLRRTQPAPGIQLPVAIS